MNYTQFLLPEGDFIMTAGTLTQDQAVACSTIVSLGYSNVSDPSGQTHLGGTQYFQISNEALENLRGKIVEVDSDGQVFFYQQEN